MGKSIRPTCVADYDWKCTAYFSQDPVKALIRALQWAFLPPSPYPGSHNNMKRVAAWQFFSMLDRNYAHRYGYTFCQYCDLPLLNYPSVSRLHFQCAWNTLRYDFMRRNGL